MIKSYFIMGWRNLWKSKLYSSLNVLGLTFGMVCFLLIGLYVYDELNFDTQHNHGDRIYRVITHEKGEVVLLGREAAGRADFNAEDVYLVR